VYVSAGLPQGFTIYQEYDDTDFLKKEIEKNFWRAALALIVLLLFIALAYRNAAQIFILTASIVVNLFLTGLCAWLLNIKIHLYTMAGLSISFGMIVDNAIMMLDHLHHRKGKNIFKAVLGATLTTIAAMLLVFFLPDEERLNLTEFCIIVSVALACSIVVATFFVPAAFHLWDSPTNSSVPIRFQKLRKKVKYFNAYQTLISFLARFRKTVIVVTILCFGLPIFLLPARWENQGWYNSTIGSELYQEKLRPHIDKYLGGALRLFARHVYEKSGYREPEKTKLYVNAALPVGQTLADMNNVLSGMEAYLKTVEGIDKYITHVYSGEYGSITILFNEQVENGSLPFQLKSRLIARSLDWGGVEWQIFGVGQGFSNASGENLPSFRVEMKGYNYDELERQANKLANKLLQHKRIQKVDIDERLNLGDKRAEQLTLQLNPSALASKGISTVDVSDFLRQVSDKQFPELTIAIDNKEVPVFLKEIQSENFSRFDVANRSHQLFGKEFDMAAFAEITQVKKASAIHKEDRQYIRIVGFDYYGSSHFGEEYLRKMLEEMKNEMPTGYTAKPLTWTWDWNKVKRQYSLLLLLLVAIYMICAILFESLKQSFVILATIPVSFIGLFLTFGWLEFYFDQGGYAAFILLGGLTVNATIFIINDFNAMRGKNKSKNRNRNIVKASYAKAIPILLTVLSTCAGLIPFLIGGQNEVFWFTLAAGTIGGLVVSLFGVFVLCPVLLAEK
jgi:multidrug efflux pump subunit AcrB